MIDDFVDLVGNIDVLLQKLAALPVTGWILLVVLLLLILLNKNAPWLFDVLDRRTAKRLEHLDRYVSSPELAAKSGIAAVRPIRDAGYFKIATGIATEGCHIDDLVKLHDTTSYCVDWRQIRLAMPFLVPGTEGFSVRKLHPMDSVVRWYNRAMGSVMTVFAAALGSASIISVVESPVRAFLGLGGAILVMLFAIFIFSQNAGFEASMRIAKELEYLAKPKRMGRT